MPVQKMRHIAEADAPRAAPLQAENLRSAFELSETCFRLRPGDRLRSVRRYRSIAEVPERGEASSRR